MWCRPDADAPWVLDVTLSEGSEQSWIYRRDPSVRRSWDLAVLRTADGVPYLAPELQLLFKSGGLRPKDDVDAEEVIPALDADQRRFLACHLGADHPWQRLLA